MNLVAQLRGPDLIFFSCSVPIRVRDRPIFENDYALIRCAPDEEPQLPSSGTV